MDNPGELYTSVSSLIRSPEIISLLVEYIIVVNMLIYWHRLLFYDFISGGNATPTQVKLVYCCGTKIINSTDAGMSICRLVQN